MRRHRRVQGWLLAIVVIGLGILASRYAGLFDWSKVQSDTLTPRPDLEMPNGAPAILSGEIPNFEQAAIPVAPSPGKPTPVDNFSMAPLDLYLRNIERAKAGTARSQYRVAQALQKCRGAVKSEERLDEIQRAMPATEEVFAAIKEHYQLCAELSSLVSDIDSEITKWLHLAAENGDPLAKSYEALTSYPNFDVDEIKVLVREALRTGEPEAYHHAVMYYANTNQPDSAFLNEAWFLIYCESDNNCDVEKAKDYVYQQYRTYERSQIASYESQLRDNLKAKRWDQLGF